MRKLRWGVLGAAKIAREKVIPAMQRSALCSVDALASRDLSRAESLAASLGVSRAFGSYEALLADPDIDAVYIPLPNHLHVPWATAAIEAGKHVLCEKPIGLDASEAARVRDAARAHPRIKVMEAFMYRFHPQWRETVERVRTGRIGSLRTIHTAFSYYNVVPHDIRNRSDQGGGALMDIGCYGISVARYLFGREPHRVEGVMEIDPTFGTDRLTSALLAFDTGTATFTCSTQLVPYQRVYIFGSEGHIEIEIPFNAPPDRPCRLVMASKDGSEEIVTAVADQYTLQGDLFSRAVLEDTPVPTPLEDAVANMRVLDAVRESARRPTGRMDVGS